MIIDCHGHLEEEIPVERLIEIMALSSALLLYSSSPPVDGP